MPKKTVKSKSVAAKVVPSKLPIRKGRSEGTPKPSKVPVPAAPTQFEFGKLLDVVERQVSRRPEVMLKPDTITRVAIEAIVKKENELIRKALKKLKKTSAWVRQQWTEVNEASPAVPLSADFTPEQYAERIRLNDKTVPPPGTWRRKLLEAGRKLKS